MKWYIIILFLIGILFFIPLPIKLKFCYIDNKIYIYIYKFKINLQKKTNIKYKKKAKSLKKQKFKIKNLNFDDIKMIVSKINCNKFKPTLKMNISLEYGLMDASSTGVAYGLISSVNPIIYNLLAVIFNIKKYNTNVNPNFHKLMLKAQIEGIIFINFVKIIYMIRILMKCFKIIKNSEENRCNYT